MPRLADSYNYMEVLCDYALITGLDPQSLQIVPVGAGKIDRERKEVISIGKLNLKRLDIIGYTMPSCKTKEVIENYIKGKITIEQLTETIESQIE